MKINFSKVIKDLEGKPSVENGRPLTLKTMTGNVLRALFNDEPGLPGDERSRRGHLAMRIYANQDLDLTVEEVALIKTLIGKGYLPLEVAQAWDILEGKESKENE